MNIITDERCAEYSAPGHPERPARIVETLKKLRSQKALPIRWSAPGTVSDEQLLRAHSPELIKSLSQKAAFDPDTPAHPQIDLHARRSAAGALSSLELALKGENSFSLLRPPGHHATREKIMGFCYLNSIAIAALEAEKRGFKKIAVFDFDVHHGNGTEDILLGRDLFVYLSVHQLPGYPGTGGHHFKNARNYPVQPARPREEYRKALQNAMDDLRGFKPDIIGVSAGFDAFREDPLSNARLEVEDFHWLGVELQKIGVPLFSVLEGGYSDQLPDLIFAYLCGLSGVSLLTR